MKLNYDYQVHTDHNVLDLENKIDNYFSAIQQISKINYELLQLRGKQKSLENEQRVFTQLIGQWSNRGQLENSNYHILFFDIERRILEGIYTLVNSYKFMLLNQFPFWHQFQPVFDQPLASNMILGMIITIN